MRAALLDQPGVPLRIAQVDEPTATDQQLLVRVHACGVCRTDLHLRDGEIEAGKLPLILGHQIVGTAVDSGELVGIPWLGWACGKCKFCRTGRENLCEFARFTGRDIDGGYAEFTVVDRAFCFALVGDKSPVDWAPLLCGGVIGYRSLRLAGDAQRIGLYGFGSAAHIICQVAVAQGRDVFAFTRPGDSEGQNFARQLGAQWAGDSTQRPPAPLDGALIFAPVGDLVVTALRAVERGGTVVCAGIHMSDIPSFPYHDLWHERIIRSVANLTRADMREFLEIVAKIEITVNVTTFTLDQAESALAQLRAGEIQGSAVIEVSGYSR